MIYTIMAWLVADFCVLGRASRTKHRNAWACMLNQILGMLTSIKSRVTMSNISSPTSKSPTPHSSPDVVPSSPRPRHFISRSDGTLTPLIAVDELPDSVRLVGIPVVLCNADTQGMVSLGVQARSHGRYIAETPNESLVDAPNEPFPVNSKVSEERSKESNTAECFEDLDTVSVKRSPASETVQRSEDQNTSEHGVEKWRQEISTAEETQVRVEIRHT